MFEKFYRWSIFCLLSALLILSTRPVSAVVQSVVPQGCNAPQLICMAARNQDLSLTLRDHCRYQQKARVELYKKKKNDETGDLDKVRETTVIVEPSARPDDTGQYPVVTRVVE